MKRLIRSVLDLVYPRACAGCGAPLRDEAGLRHICWDCRAGFPLITDGYCSRCGDPIEGVAGTSFECSACTRRTPHFSRARSAARYRGPLRVALHAFKYECFVGLGDDLVSLLHGCVRAHYAQVPFDGVLAVPLHPTKERERTYNQSAVLARGLARQMGVQDLSRQVARRRATPTQTALNAAARRRNVRDAFGVRAPSWIEGRRLLVVDDVMTTGATVDELGRALRQAGAAEVYVATVARG